MITDNTPNTERVERETVPVASILSQDMPQAGIFPRPSIAVVDDDESVRKAISRLLATAQMDAVCHVSGLALINRIETDAPDCVVLDLNMPGMSGMEVLRYLQRARISLPVIIITGDDEAAAPDVFRAAGAVTCLRKPLDGDQLIRTITEAIRKPEPGHES